MAYKYVNIMHYVVMEREKISGPEFILHLLGHFFSLSVASMTLRIVIIRYQKVEVTSPFRIVHNEYTEEHNFREDDMLDWIERVQSASAFSQKENTLNGALPVSTNFFLSAFFQFIFVFI